MSRGASGFGLFWWGLGSCVHKMFTNLHPPLDVRVCRCVQTITYVSCTTKERKNTRNLILCADVQMIF